MTPQEANAADLVRAGDSDRYLSALYAPEACRGALMALYAFNVEIARIRDVVNDPLRGEIRLQWWREAISGERAGEAAANPLSAALLSAIERHRLPLTAFDAYLEACIFDLYDDPMPTRTALEGYCGETASALIQLASLVLDHEAAARHADAAGHAGVAQAVAGSLRLLPIHRRRGQCFVPADLLSSVGLTPGEFLGQAKPDARAAAIAAMTALAREHLRKFEHLASALPASLRPAYLPASLAGLYLDRIERLGTKALAEEARVSILRRHLALFNRARSGFRGL